MPTRKSKPADAVFSAAVPTDAAALTPAQLQFHLEEYKALRTEVAGNIRAQFDAYLYALVANGGIVTWLLTHRQDTLAFGLWGERAAALVPLLVTALAYVWTIFYGRQVEIIGSYARRLEQRVGADGLGWESFLASAAGAGTASRGARRMRLAWLLWVLLGGAGAVFATGIWFA